MIEFLTQLSLMILAALMVAGIYAGLFFAGHPVVSFEEWVDARLKVFGAMAFIFGIASFLMVMGQFDAWTQLGGVLGIPVIAGSVGFSGAISYLLLKKFDA